MFNMSYFSLGETFFCLRHPSFLFHNLRDSLARCCPLNTRLLAITTTSTCMASSMRIEVWNYFKVCGNDEVKVTCSVCEVRKDNHDDLTCVCASMTLQWIRANSQVATNRSWKRNLFLPHSASASHEGVSLSVVGNKQSFVSQYFFDC